MRFFASFILSLIVYNCAASPVLERTQDDIEQPVTTEKTEQTVLESTPGTTERTGGTGQTVLESTQGATEQIVTEILHFLHFGDVHAYMEPVNGKGGPCKDEKNKDCYGGWARIIGMINKLRKKGTLVFDAGDEATWKKGTDFWNYLGMDIVPTYLNAAKLSAWTVGNHDWDGGEENLKEAIGKFINIPALGGNVQSGGAQVKWLKPYTVFKKQKLVVMGVTSNNKHELSQGLGTTKITDPIEAAKRIYKEIKDDYEDYKVIALTHIGWVNDTLLAEAVPGISIIFGGHSHTGLGGMEGGPANKDKNKPSGKLDEDYPKIIKRTSGLTCVAHAGFMGRYLGELTTKWNGNKLVECLGTYHELGPKTAEDPEMKIQVDDWRKQVDQKKMGGNINNVEDNQNTVEGDKNTVEGDKNTLTPRWHKRETNLTPKEQFKAAKEKLKGFLSSLTGEPFNFKDDTGAKGPAGGPMSKSNETELARRWHKTKRDSTLERDKLEAAKKQLGEFFNSIKDGDGPFNFEQGEGSTEEEAGGSDRSMSRGP